MNKNDYKNLFHKEWERIIEILENGEYKTFKYKACPNLNEMEKLILREIELNEDLFHNRLPCDYAMSQANENSIDKFCEFCPINWKNQRILNAHTARMDIVCITKYFIIFISETVMKRVEKN